MSLGEDGAVTAANPCGLFDQLATCRWCGHSILHRPDRPYWEDVTGWVRCPKAPADTGRDTAAGAHWHEPTPAGQPGAPVEVRGDLPEFEPRPWRWRTTP